MELAVENAERGRAASKQTLSHADKASFFVAIYQLIGEEHAPANTARVRQVLRMVSKGDGASHVDLLVRAQERVGARVVRGSRIESRVVPSRNASAIGTRTTGASARCARHEGRPYTWASGAVDGPLWSGRCETCEWRTRR